MSFEGQVADALSAVVKSPQGQTELLALVTAGEAGLTALIQNGVKNMPKPGGLAGAAIGALEGAVVAQLVTAVKADPQKLVTLIDADVDRWVKELGG